MACYAVLTFGCRVNQADSLEVERELRQLGLGAAEPGRADVVVINSCSVTAAADQGARQTIRRINRENPQAAIIVTGCYATRCAADVAALPGVTAIVANDRKSTLTRRLLDALVDRGHPAAAGFEGAPEHTVRGPGSPPLSQPKDEPDGPCGARLEPGLGGRTAWTLRVQTGCEQPCTFCIIPRTRGTSRSRPLREVQSEVERVAKAGYREIIITGVHLGSWGRDLSDSLTLVDLLRALAEHPPDVMFRISSLEPMDCTSEIRRLITGSPRFAPHFHLPLQHASNRLLREMARPYTLEYYADLVRELREALPHASIGSDILTGFPGENDEDHERLRQWLRESPLTHLHVFPYSDRPATAAALMPAKVQGGIVRQRADEIRRIGKELTTSFRSRMQGCTRPGLTLEGGALVVTDNYLKVRVAPGLPRNTRVRVRILDAGDPMTGTVTDVGTRAQNSLESTVPQSFSVTSCQ
jgi:threonylcarbamoyladenosine tRNA methylthiotransferase MtaB